MDNLKMEGNFSCKRLLPQASLPKDILLSLFKLLAKKDLASAGVVCKAWQKVAYSNEIWSWICQNTAFAAVAEISPGSTFQVCWPTAPASLYKNLTKNLVQNVFQLKALFLEVKQRSPPHRFILHVFKSLYNENGHMSIATASSSPLKVDLEAPIVVYMHLLRPRTCLLKNALIIKDTYRPEPVLYRMRSIVWRLFSVLRKGCYWDTHRKELHAAIETACKQHALQVQEDTWATQIPALNREERLWAPFLSIQESAWKMRDSFNDLCFIPHQKNDLENSPP